MGDYRDARDNATIIISYSNVLPFKWLRNVFGCPCCTYTSPVFTCLQNHMTDHPLVSDKLDILKHSRPGDNVKVNVANLQCNLCTQHVNDLPTLTNHLFEVHGKPIIKKYDSGIVPYLLDDGYVCAYCGESFERFVMLHAHVFHHLPKVPCTECGILFSADRLRKHFLRTHEKSREIKLKLKSGEYDARHNASIILECSNVCPFKWRRNVFGCAYCLFTSSEFSDLKLHMSGHPLKKDRIEILRNARPSDLIKVDMTNLQCDLCLQFIDNITTLMGHLENEHDKPIMKKHGSGIIPYYLGDGFKCAYGSCSESFDCFVKLNTHVKLHNIKFTCSQCEQYFSKKERLKNHIIRCHGKLRAMKSRPRFESTKAGLRCSSVVYNDARHNAIVIVECSNAIIFRWYRNVFGCSSCDFTAPEFNLIRTHSQNEHEGLHINYLRPTETLKAEVTDLKCNLCDQAFNDFANLLHHLGEFHNKPVKQEYGSGIIPYLLNDSFTCAVCGILFDRFTKLNRHMNEHFPNCVCSYCGQAFTTANRLKCHITWQHTHKKGRYKCSPCGMTFTMGHQKQKHMAKKHGQFPHKCPYCSERFKSYWQRLNHLDEVHGKKTEYPCKLCSEVSKSASRRAEHVRRIHLKSKLHSCSICTYSCISAAQLRKHMIRHGGERKYKCKICSKAFQRTGTLALHMRIHNKDKRFACVKCNASFVQNCSLRHHMKTRHPCDDEPSSL